MRVPVSKLKAILLFLCANTDPRFLGKVKLMKLFYFLDFAHLKKYGRPVTFDSYVNLQHGPVPSTIKNLIDDVCDEPDSAILADTIYCENREGSRINRILARRKPTSGELKLFSKTELEILNSVCERFGNQNTKYIEDASHEEAPWRMTALLEQIPYSLAANDRDCRVTKEEIELLSEIYAD